MDHSDENPRYRMREKSPKVNLVSTFTDNFVTQLTQDLSLQLSDAQEGKLRSEGRKLGEIVYDIATPAYVSGYVSTASTDALFNEPYKEAQAKIVQILTQGDSPTVTSKSKADDAIEKVVIDGYHTMANAVPKTSEVPTR